MASSYRGGLLRCCCTCDVVVRPEVHLDVVPLENHATVWAGRSDRHIDVILEAECVDRQRLRCQGLMEDEIWRQKIGKVSQLNFFPHVVTKSPKASPVEMHSFCRLDRSLRRVSFMSSGAAHTTSDTVALVLLSHDISHLARQSHSKALPRRSLQEGKRREVTVARDEKETHVCCRDTIPTALWASPSQQRRL